MQETINKIRYGPRRHENYFAIELVDRLTAVLASVLVYFFSKSFIWALLTIVLMSSLNEIKDVTSRGMAMQIEELRKPRIC